VSKEDTNLSFDELARAVAEGSLSRRRALKLFAGTAIASLIPSRALADDDHDDHDDHDDECFVPVCHVPHDPVTGLCDTANARTIFVRRRARRRHLKNHACDFKGKCTRRTTSSTTTLLGETSSTTSSTTTPLGETSSTTSSTTTPPGGSSSTTSSTTTPLGGSSSTMSLMQ
jgi:hypothetical protein